MKCRHGPSLEPVRRASVGQPYALWACSRCGRRFRWGPSRWAETIPECRGCGREIVTQVLCGGCPEDARLPDPPEVLRVDLPPARRERVSFAAPAAAELARLAGVVLSHTYRYANERELQDALLPLLSGGAEVTREARLNARDRIDFVVGDLGVEVKVDGSLAQVTRQLHRYAQVEELAGVLLVTTQAAHLAVPRELLGKPIVVARLIGGIS